MVKAKKPRAGHVTTEQAARVLGVSNRTVRKWYDAGLLKGFAFPGSNHRRISVESLDALRVKMAGDEG